MKKTPRKMEHESTSAILSDEHRQVIERVACGCGHEPTVLVDEPDTLIYLVPSLLSDNEQQSCFAALDCWDGWDRAVDDFGPQGRLTAYCGEPGAIFAYVGLVCSPMPWHPSLIEPLERVNQTIARAHETVCTACLLNRYELGEGHIPWHQDEVRAHGAAKLVVALSTGGERPFDLRRRTEPEQQKRVRLPPGSVLVMAGEAQRDWEHSLPLETYVGPDGAHISAPARISLTFRSIEIGYEEGREPPHAAHTQPCELEKCS